MYKPFWDGPLEPLGDIHFMAQPLGDAATWGRTFYGTVLNGNMRDNFNLMESCLILFDIAITRMYILKAR